MSRKEDPSVTYDDGPEPEERTWYLVQAVKNNGEVYVSTDIGDLEDAKDFLNEVKEGTAQDWPDAAELRQNGVTRLRIVGEEDDKLYHMEPYFPIHGV